MTLTVLRNLSGNAFRYIANVSPDFCVRRDSVVYFFFLAAGFFLAALLDLAFLAIILFLRELTRLRNKSFSAGRNNHAH